MGVVVGGFGGGAMVFNQIQTKIVNPNNVKVRLIIPPIYIICSENKIVSFYQNKPIISMFHCQPVDDAGERYFVDEDVLNRVPELLLILAAIYFVLGMTGALLVVQPPQEWLLEQENKKKRLAEGKLKDNEGFNNIENVESDRGNSLDLPVHLDVSCSSCNL